MCYFFVTDHQECNWGRLCVWKPRNSISRRCCFCCCRETLVAFTPLIWIMSSERKEAGHDILLTRRATGDHLKCAESAQRVVQSTVTEGTNIWRVWKQGVTISTNFNYLPCDYCSLTTASDRVLFSGGFNSLRVTCSSSSRLHDFHTQTLTWSEIWVLTFLQKVLDHFGPLIQVIVFLEDPAAENSPSPENSIMFWPRHDELWILSPNKSCIYTSKQVKSGFIRINDRPPKVTLVFQRT